jgi:hypothetical protein
LNVNLSPLMPPSPTRPLLRGSLYRSASCYADRMAREQVKEILDRVLSWPPERQADVVRVVKPMEEQDASPLQLTDEQMAEVRRRLADPNPKFVTLEEVRERFARHRA